MWIRFVDRKEGRIPVHDSPPGVDPGTPGVADEHTEHLRDAASGSSRVDVPDDPAGESGVTPCDRVFEPRKAMISDQRTKDADRLGRDIDLAKLHHELLRVGGPTIRTEHSHTATGVGPGPAGASGVGAEPGSMPPGSKRNGGYSSRMSTA